MSKSSSAELLSFYIGGSGVLVFFISLMCVIFGAFGIFHYCRPTEKTPDDEKNCTRKQHYTKKAGIWTVVGIGMILFAVVIIMLKIFLAKKNENIYSDNITY